VQRSLLAVARAQLSAMPPPRERKLDTFPLTRQEIDERIAAALRRAAVRRAAIAPRFVSNGPLTCSPRWSTTTKVVGRLSLITPRRWQRRGARSTGNLSSMSFAPSSPASRAHGCEAEARAQAQRPVVQALIA